MALQVCKSGNHLAVFTLLGDGSCQIPATARIFREVNGARLDTLGWFHLLTSDEST